MDFIYGLIMSIILSSSVSAINELRMYKDAADNGYLIDGKNYNINFDKFRLPIVRNFTISLLIPIYNIVYTIQNIIKYNQNKDKLLDNLSLMDSLDEMTEEEKKQYQKFPTGFRALVLMVKKAIKLTEKNHIQIQTPYDISEIYYDLTEDEDIEIVKVYGSLSKQTLESQKEKVAYAMFLSNEDILTSIEEESKPKTRTRKK